MSKYGIGLRNVGSYMVSGQPFITGSAVNNSDEIKIEFPFITKNITVKIPTPRNIATRVDNTANAGGDANWYAMADQSGGGLNRGPFFSGFGWDGSNPPIDYTYSLWFKYVQQDSSLYPITFLPPVGDTHMFSTQFINSTTLRFKLILKDRQ